MTVPIQGFLNAIVYGWTREDFLYVMASTSKLNRTINTGNTSGVEANSDIEGSTLLTESESSTHQEYAPHTPLSQDF